MISRLARQFASVEFHHRRRNMNKILLLCSGFLFMSCGNHVFCDEQQSTTSAKHPQHANFAPSVNATKCGEKTICKDVFNYPVDHVLKAFQSNNTRFTHFFGKDVVDTDIANRFLDADKTLCASIVQLEEPKAGKNQDDDWIFIVNHGDYKQAVEIRLCTNENSICNMDEVFPFRTECRQKYVFRKMLAIDPKDGQLKPETIKLPSCCSCHYFEKKNT